MDRQTLAAYDATAADFARDWHDQSAPVDLQALLTRYFIVGGRTADVGCGSGREVAWLAVNGFVAVGYDASEGLLAEARARHPRLSFAGAALPALAGLPDGGFDNVLCETVIMHLAPAEIATSVTRLMAILRPGGVLYLSWRITHGADQRDGHGRLYAAFEPDLVRGALGGAAILFDAESISASSGKAVHRIVVRKDATPGSAGR